MRSDHVEAVPRSEAPTQHEGHHRRAVASEEVLAPCLQLPLITLVKSLEAGC
jgi:hypothetical protein